MDRWKDALQVLVVTAAAAWAVAGVPFGPVLVAVVGIPAAWWFSPLQRGGRHVPHDVAQRRAGADDVVVYSRPGCSYCVRLWWRLTAEQRAAITWINPLRDRRAEAYVRDLRDGDMVTPTAVTGDGRRLDADAGTIAAQLAAA